MFPILSLVLLLSLGCAQLVIDEDDTALTTTGKVGVRTVNCLLTMWAACGSEWIAMAQAKAELEEHAYPITTGSHTLPRPDHPLTYIVSGNHVLATAETQQIIAQMGGVVIERTDIGAVQEEQRFRLLHTADTEADLLHVGKLTGADRLVRVEAAVHPARFGLSLVPHYALSVTIRAVSTDTGRITWQGTARYSAPLPNPDTWMGPLTAWAISRALCPSEEGARWIEPGPYRTHVGCLTHPSN
jgi:hypothetical protein